MMASGEFLKNSLSDDHKILHTYLGQSAWWIAASVRLQNAVQYCTKVRKTGLAGKESNNCATFNVDSPNCTRTSRRHSLQPDRMWSHQLLPVGIYRSSKKEQPKMPPRTALRRMLVARRFAWPNQLVCFLLARMDDENVCGHFDNVVWASCCLVVVRNT